MFCQICSKNKATVHYTELSDNKVVEIHVCEKCALEKGVSVKPNFLLADLLAGLAGLEKVTTPKEDRKCGNCGLSYSDFKTIGRLGCAECYRTFKNELNPLLKKIHGSLNHAGKIPAAGDKEVSKAKILRKLRSELRELVEKEDFEEAARVRDEIKALET